MADETIERQGGGAQAELDSARLQFAVDKLRAQQNLAGGVIAGAIASAAGAGVWAGVTVATGYQIGWMAVGVGFLVGYAVRLVGKGVDNHFGYVGAGLALLGCAAGNLLAVCGWVAQEQGIGFVEVLSGLDFAVVQELMVATFSPIDLLFYGIAVYEGYKLSFRWVTHDELSALVPGS